MLLTVGLLLLVTIGLCRLYKSDREFAWLLAIDSVVVGLLLLSLPALNGIAFVLAGQLAEWARIAAELAAPFLLPVILFVLLWRMVRRWWRLYQAFGPLERGRVLLLSACLGLAIAALLRVAPYLSDAAGIAGEGARAGWNAGFDRAVDEAGERVSRGDAP